MHRASAPRWKNIKPGAIPVGRAITAWDAQGKAVGKQRAAQQALSIPEAGSSPASDAQSAIIDITPHLLTMRNEIKQSGGWKDRRGSASSRGYGARWRKLRERVKQRDKGLCQRCWGVGRVREHDAVDHIVNKARTDENEWITSADGTRMHVDDLRNLQCICKVCHAKKTSEEGRRSRKKPQFNLDGWPIEEPENRGSHQ